MAEDRRIDDALRNVPLPPGLADRVVPETLFDDAALDRLLGRVPLPAGLSDRVRAAVFTPAAGRGVDLERAAGGLRPAGKPTAPRQRGRLGRWSLAVAQSAASVAVLLAALGGLVLTGFEFARWVEPTAPQPAVVLAPQRPSPGVLPLEFPPGENAASLGISGHEVFEITGLAGPLNAGELPRQVTVNAGDVEFSATVRIDTPKEAEYFRQGGILRYVLRQLAAA